MNTVVNLPAVVGVLVHLGKLTLNSRDEIPAPYIVKIISLFVMPKKMVYMLGKLVMSQNQILESTEARLRGQSIKKPNFFFLIYCFIYNLIKFVSFRVLPSTLDTPLPTFFPVLERLLERVLRDGTKVPCRIFFYLLYRLKSATY